MQISWSLRLRFLVCLIHPLPFLVYEHPIPFMVVVADADDAGQLRMGLHPNCSTSCGGVTMPYPFGIEPGCYLGESFK